MLFTRFTFKTNTALFISLTFVFRILFVNVYAVTPVKTSHSNKLTASHYTKLLKKRRRITETDTKSTKEIYSAVEVCEENSDNEEEQIKASSSVLLSFLYSLFSKTLNSSESNNLFYFRNYNLFPKRYLSLSVLRV